jgi:hypothetical protein
MKIHRTHSGFVNVKSLRAGAALLAAISVIGCSRQEVPVVSTAPAETLAPAAQPKGIIPLRVAPTPARKAYESSVETPSTVIKQRSKKSSALIVGGSAAAGAAVGALAGGGKGAGIGAIAGGLGGLVYDRSTAKKTVPAN